MATSLLDWIMDLMGNTEAREAFNANPQAAMASAGFTNVCGADIADSRVFLVDKPEVKEVAGVELPPAEEADAATQVTYIVNNFAFEAPAPADGPEIDESTETETTTVTDSSTETETEANTIALTDASTETSDDGDDVSGDNSVGENQLNDSPITEVEDGFVGQDFGLIGLNDTVDTGDITVVGDLVEDSLNGSLNDNLNGSLNDLAENAAQNLVLDLL